MVASWLFLQGVESKYWDLEGSRYEYPPRIPNGGQVKEGDTFVLAVPKKDADGDRRILGFGRLGLLVDKAEDRRDAVYDRYHGFKPALSFQSIGGDPRPNPINSINRIDPAVVDRLLAISGFGSVEDLPFVTPNGDNDHVSNETIREQLHAAVVDDLLGPSGGPDEEIVDSSVRSRYLVGQLAPMNLILEPEEQDELPKEGTAGTDDGESEEDRLQSESLMPSSIGFTFTVGGATDRVRVEARWGRYERTKTELGLLTESGQARTVWKRRAAGGAFDVDLGESKVAETPDADSIGVVVRGTVRSTADGDRLVTLFLVNEQTEPDKNRDSAWVFQPELIVTSPDSATVFRRRPMVDGSTGVFGGPEARAMRMLHRNRVEFAVGHGVSVHANVPDESKPDRSDRIETRVIPFYDVPVTETPAVEDPGFERLADLELDMQWLAEASRSDVVNNLRVLTEAYADWQKRQLKRIKSGEMPDHEIAADEAILGAKRALTRLNDGIAVLADESSPAFEAFQFANRVMWLQRVRSEYVRQRRRGDELDLADVDVPASRSWRPFQLAFVLLAVPGLADPTHAERAERSNAIADLLWFPTGGGKTEAYLGVAAFTMALRRLQGDLGGYEASRGVAVIMRYTLRLLTIQQFQRATTLLAAMEVVRRETSASGDDRWGEEPFRLGLWVGNSATPGRTSHAEEAIKEAKGDTWNGGGGGSPAQLTTCPWSGHEIVPGRDIAVRRFRGDVGRTLTFCSDPMGQCPFSRAKAPDEGLPVVVVDQEIYQRLPTMIIATVDKFAQMPWKGETQMLYGRVSGYCDRHGFLSPSIETETRADLKCTGNHPKRGNQPATKQKAAGPLRPPDLIIQDELHLISGPLGTIVGLYETAVDQLSTWEVDGVRVHPKVIASTATIRKAREQVHSLFLRKVEVFPPHGLDIEDNFFSLQRPTAEGAKHRQPGRRYLGICAPGKSRPATLIRVYVAFLTAAQKLYEEHGESADPWMTLVGYFNSLRELGGMRRLVEDDVSTRAFRMNQPNSDIERPGLAQRKRVWLEELTSRRSSTDIPRILDQLEVGFDPDLAKQRAIDVLLATNMVSVGVDVQRLGLMVVAGQPKTTAEYIQATSRVGRRHPGIVCTVLNWARPRDLSHYETFEHYHATFYEHVEALTLTPFAPRAVDRALTGVFTSMTRLDGLELDPNDGASMIDPNHPVVQRTVEQIIERAFAVTDRPDLRDLVETQLKALVHEWTSEVSQPDVKYGYRTRKDGVTVGLLKPPSTEEWDDFTVLTSMRDVEPTAGLILSDTWGGKPPDWESPQGDSSE